MGRPRRNGEWSVVLFVVALLAFNPPVLSIFSVPELILGIPTLYLYIFIAWGGVIALLALNVPGLMAQADAEGPPREGSGDETVQVLSEQVAAELLGRGVRHRRGRAGMGRLDIEDAQLFELIGTQSIMGAVWFVMVVHINCFCEHCC